MSQTDERPRIGILFGGRSAEHDVSIMSATNVMAALAPEKYDAMPIFITRDGRWLLSQFENGELLRPDNGPELCLLPGGRGRLFAIDSGGTAQELPRLSALFPVLHGLFGEDGSVQGAAEVARVPLVGCGILGSAVALDKRIAKQLLLAVGLPVARAETIQPHHIPTFSELRDELGLPIFIKPARQGSSVGVSKVGSEADYQSAVANGFRHDSVLLAEEFVDGREVECSVLEDEDGGNFRVTTWRDCSGRASQLLQL